MRNLLNDVIKYSPNGVTSNIFAHMPSIGGSQKTARRLFKAAVMCHSDYIKNCKLNDDIINCVVQLSQLDNAINRVGYIYPNLGKVDKLIVNELREDLLKLAKTKDFTSKSYCALNPVFRALHLVVGADADLIIDDTLVDIKTIKSGRMDISQLYQLIGYFILSGVGGVDGKKINITRLGIYFSRYGELLTFPAAYIENDKFPQLVRWFQKTAEMEGDIDSSTGIAAIQLMNSIC
jgi:hypothetical protein